MKSDAITVLIVDDHVLFRDGVRTLLMGNDDIQLVGEAENGEDAIRLAEQHQPDVILMDIQMSGMNGIETTRQIANASPHIFILMVTMFDDDQSVFAAMRAGARGYILKGAKHDEMLRAIEAAGHGEAIFSPTIATRMMAFFSRIEAHQPTEPLFPELGERERIILTLIAQGKSNTEISQMVSLSLKTIQNHVSNILNKLQVADRSQAILRARAAGLGKDDPS